MTPTPLEDQVNDALHRRVDPIHHSPLTVADVRHRARRIRRRRTVAAGATVAAVLAIAVPVGLGLTGPAQRSVVPPATQSPAPAIAGTVRIDPRSAAVGDELTVPLINVDDVTLTADGETTDLPRLYDQLTPYLDGWIGIGFTDDVGGLVLQELTSDFRVLDEASPAGRLIVSPDAARIAWTEYDGSRWVVVDRAADGAREERRTAMPPGPEDAGVRAVGFLADDGLVVARTDPATGDESALVVSPTGRTAPLGGFIHLSSAAPASGLVAGQTRFTGDGSCWQVSDAAVDLGSARWQTCDYSLLAFSPDGQHLVGVAPYLDGNGSPTLAILDAATGEPVVDFELAGARTRVVGIHPEVVWEDDTTVVATLVTGGQQYVVRLGLDGTVERVGGDSVSAEPGTVPLKLAAAIVS